MAYMTNEQRAKLLRHCKGLQTQANDIGALMMAKVFIPLAGLSGVAFGAQFHDSFAAWATACTLLGVWVYVRFNILGQVATQSRHLDDFVEILESDAQIELKTGPGVPSIDEIVNTK